MLTIELLEAGNFLSLCPGHRSEKLETARDFRDLSATTPAKAQRQNQMAKPAGTKYLTHPDTLTKMSLPRW